MPKSGCSQCKHCKQEAPKRPSKKSQKLNKLQRPQESKKTRHKKTSHLKKSASSSFIKRHHNHCMCQVCTCQKPEHKCPINYIKRNFNGITNYQREYIPFKIEKPNIYIARDNLKSKKKFMNGTEYMDAYKKKPSEKPERKKHDEQVKEMILHTNQKSHIKDLMGGRRPRGSRSTQNLERVKSANFNKNPKTSHFYQPSRFVKPDQRNVQRQKMESKTAYQNDFPGYKAKSGRKKHEKINYDNLIVGNPDFRFKGTTEYRDKHRGLPNEALKNKNQNDYIYNLIKFKNNMTHTLNGDYRNLPTTEYQRNYTKKQVRVDRCPIENLPRVDSQLRNMPNHVYFNKNKKNWVLN